VRILCQKSTKDIEYAEKLLKFVEYFIIIYRPEIHIHTHARARARARTHTHTHTHVYI